MAAWRQIDSVPDGNEALFWLYRVAYRTIGRQWRGAARKQRLERKLAGLGREIPVPPDDFVIQDEESRDIIEAAYRLRPTDREALLLADWEGLPGKEVARVLAISPEAAKKRIQRARQNLAREYDRIRSKSYLPTAQEGGAR